MYKFKLWCAATLSHEKLGSCPADVDRFRSSCLSCRLRRLFYGLWKEPDYYVKYVFRNIVRRYLVDVYEAHGLEYRTRSGRKLLVTRSYFLLVDPRGHLLGLRIAAIKVCDALIGLIKPSTKPFIEFAELFASYPLW